MRHGTMTLALVLFVALGTVMTGIAGQHGGGMRKGKMMHRGGKTEAKGESMMGGGMMGGGMMRRQVVPTEDGGIVILMGDKIVKYDKNLNMVNETEIEIDEDEMMRMMKKRHRMQKKCRKMMEGDEEYEEDE